MRNTFDKKTTFVVVETTPRNPFIRLPDKVF